MFNLRKGEFKLARTNRRREKNIDDMLDRKRKISDKRQPKKRKNIKNDLKNFDPRYFDEDDIENFYE